ncbi:MAG: ABC transporter permease [Bacteroidales bacterium]|nr:ABC transporter permease [Bacteroidales bacterium]
MKKLFSFIRRWWSDFYAIMTHELKMIFSDSGVMVIFFLAGLAYPVIYNLIYANGSVDEMPIAVVDLSGSAESRSFTRKLDATREVDVAYRCTDMEEAERLMKEQKIRGIVMFPKDFDEKLARMEQATISTYADMSSFLYYKNLTMSMNYVMLDEARDIQMERYAAAGYAGEAAVQLVDALPYEENMPYNRTFAYSIFFLSAALMIVLQQTMFYGVSMLAGTMREENRSFAVMPDGLKGRGITRVIAGRGTAYWLIYIILGVYVACLIPYIFGLPQRGEFRDIFTLLMFYIPACVMFSFAFSSVIARRETVFVLFLFFSPVCLFLTGFSWPMESFPAFWRYFAYIFPSTFAARGFINLNTAGADLYMIRPEIIGLTVQTIVYYILSCISIYVENKIIHIKEKKSGSASGQFSTEVANSSNGF